MDDRQSGHDRESSSHEIQAMEIFKFLQGSSAKSRSHCLSQYEHDAAIGQGETVVFVLGGMVV